MSFRPGDRVVKIATIAGHARVVAKDALGTVLDIPVPRRPGFSNKDFVLRDDAGRVMAAVSRLWRRIDDNDPSGITTVSQLVRSLGSADSIRERAAEADGELVP